MFRLWWGRQLAGLLPARWRQPDGAAPPRDAVTLAVLPAPGDRPQVELIVRRAGSDGDLGRFVLEGSGLQALRDAVGTVRRFPVRLRVPPRLFLEQQVTLPLAAERELDSVLRYEMDRLTPFAAEAVHWSWRVEQRDRQRGWLRLRLMLVPKSAVAAILQALASVGLLPSALIGADAGGCAIPLTRPRISSWTTRARAVAATAFVVLLLAAASIPFVRQSLEARRLEERIAAARPDVDAADALRKRLQERATSADVVAAEGGRVGDALRVLADLTDMLPDDSFLYELALRDRVLTISGQSASAARLIPLLAADPVLRNPAFAAPVTRNETTGVESFSIRAEVVR